MVGKSPQAGLLIISSTLKDHCCSDGFLSSNRCCCFLGEFQIRGMRSRIGNNECLLCCVNFLFSVVETLVRFFNKYAYVQVCAGPLSCLCCGPDAHDCWRLFELHEEPYYAVFASAYVHYTKAEDQLKKRNLASLF